jgi:hypothetical protein
MIAVMKGLLGQGNGWAQSAWLRLRGVAGQAWPLWSARRKAVITAMMVGERCAAVRMATGGTDGRLRLVAASAGGPEVLPSWAQLAKGSTPLLVLGPRDRQIQSLDKPQVLDSELAMAVRWPAAAAQDIDPDLLLCTALPVPAISSTARPQVLAISSPLATAKTQLDKLRDHRLDVRHIDVIDSALLGILRLQAAGDDACVTIAAVGGSLCIGLMWQGRFGALRTLALPTGQGRQGDDFQDALSLHIQRSVDSFERQATLLSIRRVVLSLPAMSYAGREAVAATVPSDTRIFDLEHWVDVDPAIGALLRGHEELHALACVAACRLMEPTAAKEAAPAEAAAPVPEAAMPTAAPTAPANTPSPARPPAASPNELQPLQMPGAGGLDFGSPDPAAVPADTDSPAAGAKRPGEKPTDQWMLQP